MTLIPSCRFCATPLTAQLCDLGETPLANAFLTEGQVATEKRYPLVVRVCPACLLVQASDSLAPGAIFSDYPYFSSMSEDWVAHARAFAAEATQRFALDASSRVVEIASNDGYLLQHFVKQGIPVLGVEPEGSDESLGDATTEYDCCRNCAARLHPAPQNCCNSAPR